MLPPWHQRACEYGVLRVVSPLVILDVLDEGRRIPVRRGRRAALLLTQTAGARSGLTARPRTGSLRPEVPKTSADSCGGRFFRRARLLPRPSEVSGQLAGEPELGEDHRGQPGPTVGRFGAAELRAGPAQGLLEHAEGVLDVEPVAGMPARAGRRRRWWRRCLTTTARAASVSRRRAGARPANGSRVLR